jgi:S1-C subfamily serine protease
MNTIKRFVKLLVSVFLVLIGGALGGLAAFLYFAGLLPFKAENYENIKPVPVIEKQEVTIQENKALTDAVAKVDGIAIGIKVVGTKGLATYGSGVILSSDGLAAVPYSLYPPGAAGEVVAAGKKTSFQILKRDKSQNLILLKLDGSNWSTAGFYQLDGLNLGERVFLAGVLPAGGSFVSEGIVRDFSTRSIATNIFEKAEAEGSPVFDIEGNIIGIADVARSGQVSVIPIDVIKGFSGL